MTDQRRTLLNAEFATLQTAWKLTFQSSDSSDNKTDYEYFNETDDTDQFLEKPGRCGFSVVVNVYSNVVKCAWYSKKIFVSQSCT